MSSIAVSRPATSNLRWIVCGLLFFATVIAYVDRGVLAYLEKTLEGIIGFNAKQYSYMTVAFSAAYALGLVGAGRLTDRLGTRRGFAFAIAIWSVAAMAPGAASSVATFAFAMFFLGFGEAANFPACIKTVAEWFPKSERALATGIFNSGANAGAVLVPIIVPFLAAWLGWRGAFVGCGSLGFVWLACWLLIYRKPEEHPSISARELGFIQSDPPEKIASVPWLRLLPLRETWAFALGKFFSDPPWWFYLFWLPRYLEERFHLNPAQNRLPVVTVYVISAIGSVAGGWLAGAMLKRGRSLNFTRKTTLLLCTVVVLPVLAAPFVHELWVVVALVGLAMAAHQGWSCNLFTLPSDMFPKAAVASVVGIGGMMGAVGNTLFQFGVGRVVDATHSYVPVFVAAGSLYLIALLAIHLLTPKLAPARLD
ncbi:MAG TPA: MFS transporter [Bryobacteraceae bacterium]|nr:MFS transporter [Bryobacteraceae bacterium]